MANDDELSHPNYEELVSDLHGTHPRVHFGLLAAHALRSKRLESFRVDIRFVGLEGLLIFLEAARSSFAKHPVLQKIGFLLERAIGDYQTAIDATLAGYNSVASESMRDVMEIQFLVRDFAFEPNRIDEWLNADSRLRYQEYRPAMLRKRDKKRRHAPPKQPSSEDSDYAAHSEDLHVNPRSFLQKGLINFANPIEWDIGFSEMFEHGDRLIKGIADLVDHLAPELDGEEGPFSRLPEFYGALAATRKSRLAYRKWVKEQDNKENRGPDAQ